jgi:hypothetical protein
MNCVILQPSYIPWRGYFHQVYKSNLFIFYDDVQYDKNGWRNRNRIKTRNGVIWLTIPVLHRGNVNESIAIKDIRIDWSKDWARKHWMSIQQSCSKAPFFDRYAPGLEPFFMSKYEFLADFTIDLTIHLARLLGIEHTRFLRSSSLQANGMKTDRLVDILQKVAADHYISGPAARDYLEEDKLAAAGISLEWMVYDYPEYPQLYPPFDPQLSILDLLFNTGPQAGEYIWGKG